MVETTRFHSFSMLQNYLFADLALLPFDKLAPTRINNVFVVQNLLLRNKLITKKILEKIV